MTRRVRIFSMLLATIPNFIPGIVFAQNTSGATKPTTFGFNPELILSDDDIFDVNGMTPDRLTRFLRSKGTLADTRKPDIDGVLKPIPDIIMRVAYSYKINPKYLVALLQKEQSLVEDPDPSQKQFDWATGYAICDNCSKNDPSLQDFKGFAAQLEWAAKQHREKYLIQLLSKGTTRAGKAPGKPMTINNQTITPQNAATAMLYSYTPHILGNLNLWKIWQRWFSLKHPDGTIVRGKDSGSTYLIRFGQKRKFASRAVLESLVDTTKIVSISDVDLTQYPDGPSIQFPNFSLLKDEKSRLWLITWDTKRQIENMKVFRNFGFNEDELVDVTTAEISEYKTSDTITTKTIYPQGALVKETGTENFWYVEAGIRHKLPHKSFVKLYFSGRKVREATSKKIATYKLGDPFLLKDGELVRATTKSAVFVVENQQLRPIPTAEIFEGLGWKWTNVVTLPDSVISGYARGEPVDAQTSSPTRLTQTTSAPSSTQLGAL